MSFGNLERDDGSLTTSWKESAELLLERFLPSDEEDARDGSHQHIRELVKSYQNCNGESPVIREEISRCIKRSKNSKAQFGFKASLSAEDTKCKTLGTLKNTNKKFVLLLFIDIQGAFDNLWWPSILLRLIKVGISSYIFDTLKDYFSGRSVSLMAEDRSMMISREAERGCPQGSIVGPYVWRWCMDELLSDARCEWSSDTVEWVAYADDIVIAVKGNRRFELERLSERCLSHLMSWCGRYKLPLPRQKPNAC